MTVALEFGINQAQAELVAHHLQACNAQFVPPLSMRVDIESYAKKIVQRATRFEAWQGGVLVGLLAVYFDGSSPTAGYVTNVSVLPSAAGQKLASRLLRQCVSHARQLGAQALELEVAVGNERARHIYNQAGFQAIGRRGENVKLQLHLTRGAP